MRAQVQEQKNAQVEIMVKPGDCRFSTDPNCRLISRRIQSSIALAVHVPKLKLGALLRFVAPNSAINPAQTNPWLFADTAIPLLFTRLRAIRVTNHDLSVQDLSVYAIGGSAVGTEDDSGVSGKSNDLAMRRLLWREGVLLNGADTGGTTARSVWLDAASGRILVSSQPVAAVPAARLSKGVKLCHFAS